VSQSLSTHSPADLNFLNSYDPLIGCSDRRAIIADRNIPPYVDRSCRREPDFENEFPSITALCRAGLFVTRVSKGDFIIYRTNKGKYEDVGFRHWRIVALLQAIEVLGSHDAAAEWYTQRGLQIPTNCMIRGNHPKPFDESRPRKAIPPITSTRAWDGQYLKRARQCGIFVICKPLFLDIRTPPVWTETDEHDVFGKRVGTRNPPAISKNQLQAIADHIGVSAWLK